MTSNIIPRIKREYEKIITLNMKRKIIEYLMNNKILCKTGKEYWDNVESDNRKGYIKSISDGCWGYSGDAIAVKILEDLNSETSPLDVKNLYPANVIINLNVDDELFNKIVLLKQ